MPTVLKSTIKTEAYFSEDNKYRYLLRKEWDKGSKTAMVIMIHPSIADTVLLDHTTIYVINNLHSIGYGSVEIVNLFSKIDTKINLKEELSELIGEETNRFIRKAGYKADIIIIAWGSIGDRNKKVKARQDEVLDLLREYKEKMNIICDPRGKRGLHPLCPSVRNGWILEPCRFEGKAPSRKPQKDKETQSKTKGKPKGQKVKKELKEGKEDD